MNMSLPTRSLRIWSTALSLLAVAGTAFAQVNPHLASNSPFIPTYPGGAYGVPLATGGELFANGGEVTVTYLGHGGAAYTEFLQMVTPGGTYAPGVDIINNQTTAAGSTFDLGTFAAGEEVEFDIFVQDTGNTWFDGPGTRNADGAVHANVVDNFNYTFNGNTGNPGTSGPGTSGNGIYVGFEDEIYPGGDFNYADLQFVFNGVNGAAVPDAATTMSLLGMSLGGLAFMKRKLKK
jgi:hypothetical protein